MYEDSKNSFFGENFPNLRHKKFRGTSSWHESMVIYDELLPRKFTMEIYHDRLPWYFTMEIYHGN